MSTLLTSCADRLDYAPFLGRLADGLKDDADIKLLCHRMLISLAEIAASAGAPPTASAALRESLDSLVEPLRSSICATLKENAVKQQVERHEEQARHHLVTTM